MVKNPPANAADTGSSPGPGRKLDIKDEVLKSLVSWRVATF